MTRRFEVGPILVALGAVALLVSLFMEWYGPLSAWDAFEVVEVLLTVLAFAALVVAVGMLVPDIEMLERRWLPPIVFAVAVLVAAELVNPPPAAAEDTLGDGAWLAFGAALVMLAGTVLSFGRISLAVAVEGRDVRERVAVVDHRQDTTETAAIRPAREETTQPAPKAAGEG
jgi:hypothetical protein